MCGILAILGLPDTSGSSFRSTVLKLSKRLRHRGPDWSGLYYENNMVLAHERLSIVNPTSGAQPIFSDDRSIVLAVNGEIYNHVELRQRYGISQDPSSSMYYSDCEVILRLYEQDPEALQQRLTQDIRGMFAFVLYDSKRNRYIAARDPIGIIPLYMGWSQDGAIWFASELKALADHCHSFRQFPPGHMYDSSTSSLVSYYAPEWMTCVPTHQTTLQQIRQALEESVEAHLMSDVPFGVLLSGGLDSSLVASIANRIITRGTVATNQNQALPWHARLRSYSVGLEGSPDLKAAQQVAEFLGTAHHSFTYTLQDGLDALSDVIYFLETYDVTTIRASTPMYLMARLIKSTGVKMVLSGEGADELFGGYLYFHKAPNAKEFHEETVRKLQQLHMYDCLRANKAMSAFGVEARVPFLDTRFVDMAMGMDPSIKMAKDPKTGQSRMEKWCLREAFNTPDNPYLPDQVLWRQKEQFSDGVGYGWIDALKDHAERQVTDTMLETAELRFPENTPLTKEAYLYRQLFEGHFPQPSARKTIPGGPSIACSTPTAIAWDKSFASMADPSGRAVMGVHQDAYTNPLPQ